MGCKPKLKGAGGGIGVEVPDDVLVLVPKKSGTPFEVMEGLAIPGTSDSFGPAVFVSPSPANRDDEDVGPGFVDALNVVRRKKPSAGLPGAVSVCNATSGGDSGSGMIDPAARGEDARGRVDAVPFMRGRGPPESLDEEGTLKDTTGAVM